MKKFSIITVALNEERNIRKTCESVCSQDFDDFEWIVIDGGSTDGTLGILEEYKKKISYLSSEPDDGIYDAMNKGIEVSTGEYLVFMNAGDSFYDASALSRVSKSPNKDVLCGDFMCVAADGRNFVKEFPKLLPRDFLVHNMLPHQASFFKRGLFSKYGVYDTSYRIAGDYEIFVRFLYVNNASYWHVPHVVAVFGIDGISSNRMYKKLRRIENHRVRKTYFPWSVYGLKRIENELKIRFFNR